MNDIFAVLDSGLQADFVLPEEPCQGYVDGFVIFGGLLEHAPDLVGLSFSNQIPGTDASDELLASQDNAGLVFLRHQSLIQDHDKAFRQLHPYLLLLLRGKDVDDPLDG